MNLSTGRRIPAGWTRKRRGENTAFVHSIALSASRGRTGSPRSNSGILPFAGTNLFCGHRGCGKSTELRRIRNDLHAADVYYVAFADASRELDPNNLRYQDVLLHLAATLTRQLEDDGVSIDPVHLERLQSWFDQRVQEQSEIEELTSQVKTGAQVAAGLPYLGRLLAEISTAFKTNATYKETLRRTLKNYFSDFAEAFNHLISAAEDVLSEAGKGRRILFMLDGTDRLPEEDAHAFFITDVHQLQQVNALFVYCAPIHLIYEAASIEQNFDDVFRLPMIKIQNAGDSASVAGRRAMRDLLYRRAAPELFDDGVTDYLIDHSGGHPRDLLRLLQQAFQYAENDRFDHAAAPARRERNSLHVSTFPGTGRLSASGRDRFYRLECGSTGKHRTHPPTALQPRAAGVQRPLLAQSSRGPDYRCLPQRKTPDR